MAEPLRLSIVIATLGGGLLNETIGLLNSGKCIPTEILVCLPESDALNQPRPEFDNVRLVATPYRGQVAQRAHGLKQAREGLVLQIDDDIRCTPQTLETLTSALLSLGRGNVVAPLLRDLDGGSIPTFRSDWYGAMQSLQASIICGAPWGMKRMGKLTPAGIGYWFDRIHVGEEPIEAEWLPGGCVLCFKEDLVLDSYYPFAGKAFSEDLIHSVLWRRRGIRLWAIPSAECLTTITPMPFDLGLIWADFRAHMYVVRMINGQAWRLGVWFAYYAVKMMIGFFWDFFFTRRDR